MADEKIAHTDAEKGMPWPLNEVDAREEVQRLIEANPSATPKELGWKISEKYVLYDSAENRPLLG